MMNIDLNGQTALITGAGGGIGKSIGEQLIQCGAKVIWSDLPDTANALVGAGIEPQNVVSGDITDPTDAQQMTDRAVEVAGNLDILVNCAGIPAVVARTTDQNLTDWKRVVDVNLQGKIGRAHV